MNLLIYIAIFGFFRSYPMYLVNRFHLMVSPVSTSSPGRRADRAGQSWRDGMADPRVPVRSLTIWTAALTGLCMAAIVLPAALIKLPLLLLGGIAVVAAVPVALVV